MSKLTLAQLDRHLLGAADELRGKMDETKYHEYPITKPLGRSPRQRYLEVTEKAELFDAERLDKVWTTDLGQIWRDHLLALACQQEAANITAVRYVLLAPSLNPPWAILAERYTGLLKT